MVEPPAPGSQTVSRPEPGLARGKWEGPAWLFWAILGVAVIAATLYALRRLGILRLPKK